MSRINKFNSNAFEVVFSNIPTPKTNTEALDLKAISLFVKSISIPDYNMDVIQSDFGGIRRLSPVNKVNTDFSTINIDFHVDEDATNWFAFYEWLQELKAGRPTLGETLLHKSTIKAISCVFKDNEKRPLNTLIFQDCLLISLSSLLLSHGQNDEVIFTCTFQYDQWVRRKNTAVNTNN